MHTLARVLLHGRALMVRMKSEPLAQHGVSEVFKVSSAFKSTVAAVHAALSKPTSDDPHMRYLMRQATHLAALLTTLLKTLKGVEQV